MWVLMPDEPHIGFVTLAVIFVSATLLGFASHAPGGIGAFDAAMLKVETLVAGDCILSKDQQDKCWSRTTRTSSSWTKAHSGVIRAHSALAFQANRAQVSATAWADLRCAPRDLASSPCRAGLVLAGAACRRTFGGGRAGARRWGQAPRRNLGSGAWPCRSRPRPRPGGGSSSGPRRGQSRAARAPVRSFRCRSCAWRAQDHPTRLR
jgi:hypothetical protein